MYFLLHFETVWKLRVSCVKLQTRRHLNKLNEKIIVNIKQNPGKYPQIRFARLTKNIPRQNIIFGETEEAEQTLRQKTGFI